MWKLPVRGIHRELRTMPRFPPAPPTAPRTAVSYSGSCVLGGGAWQRVIPVTGQHLQPPAAAWPGAVACGGSRTSHNRGHRVTHRQYGGDCRNWQRLNFGAWTWIAAVGSRTHWRDLPWGGHAIVLFSSSNTHVQRAIFPADRRCLVAKRIIRPSPSGNSLRCCSPAKKKSSLHKVPTHLLYIGPPPLVLPQVRSPLSTHWEGASCQREQQYQNPSVMGNSR